MSVDYEEVNVSVEDEEVNGSVDDEEVNVNPAVGPVNEWIESPEMYFKPTRRPARAMLAK